MAAVPDLASAVRANHKGLALRIAEALTLLLPEARAFHAAPKGQIPGQGAPVYNLEAQFKAVCHLGRKPLRGGGDVPSNLIGVGIYSVPEAARLSRVSASTIRRWLRGYQYPTKHTRGASPPVWESQLEPIGRALALGFRDLQEVRYVQAFRPYFPQLVDRHFLSFAPS